jgi:hypothetical protein
VKENLKPCVYKLWNTYLKVNRVLFVERSGELHLLARLRTKSSKPKGNQVLIGREVLKDTPKKSVYVDPKPGDLSMSRLKLP